MYGEDRWKIGPWYLESLALVLGPKSLLTSLVLDRVRFPSKLEVLPPFSIISFMDNNAETTNGFVM